MYRSLIQIILFISFARAQVLIEPFKGEEQDSFEVKIQDRMLRVVSTYDNYILLEDRDKPFIYFFSWKDKQIFPQEHRKYKNYAISGFGVSSPDTFYVVLARCGREGTDLLQVDIKNSSTQSKRILTIHASSSAFKFIQNHFYLLLAEWDNIYVLYDCSSNQLLPPVKLKRVFNNHANCSFSYPYANVSFLNDSILAVNFTANATIYFWHLKHNIFVSSICNPNTSFRDAKLIFEYISHEIPIPYPESIVLDKHVTNLTYFKQFTSFERDGKTFYYQFAIPPLAEIDLEEYYSLKRPNYLTIWNENFEIIHNFYMPHGRFFIDGAGNLYSYSHRATGVMVNFYGPIVQTKSLRTTMKE